MNNYLLSIDPSMKNTGFTLWENKKPIWITSYSFKKYERVDFYFELDFLIKNKIWISTFDEINLIIERGTFHSKNGIGYETQEHLRGFIAGQFNKLITKDMLISPSEWKSWYRLNFNIDDNFLIKWTKELSIQLANQVIQEQGWNITISNHDEAESLLIGWYYLNKENK